MGAEKMMSSLEDLKPLEIPPMGRTSSGRTWVLREADIREAMMIMQSQNIDIVLARALTARGVNADEAAAYLSPSLREALPDPFVLFDMEKATNRLLCAVLSGEKIGVFGDYDVDGTTASSILHLYFRQLGIEVPVYLPDRVMEGYGPSVEAFLSLKNQGVSVIVTVDCGAMAHDAIEGAVENGLEVVVIDHHQMLGRPPEGASAIVNPNRPEDKSGLGNLSAAGVAFMLVVSLNRALRAQRYFSDQKEPNLLELLDLTALGLVCDVMEMTGLTRVLVSQGLKILGKNGNMGLKALGGVAGVKGVPNTYHLGFLLGPRINAAGRIGHARLALELLTTSDAARRETLANKLHLLNAERQEIEFDIQEQAIAKIESEKMMSDPVIVVAGDGWHPGVIGIVAGRLKEKYDRPVVVIGVENGVGKGSGRSIEGVDLGISIGTANSQDVLLSGGGHAMAAGLSIDASKIDLFRDYLRQALETEVTVALEHRTRRIDGVVFATAVTKTMANRVDTIGPFGPGNPEPVFMLHDLRVQFAKVVGKGHLSCTLVSRGGEKVRAIAFRAEGEPLGDMLSSGEWINVLGKIKADDWRGGDHGQFQIMDAAIAL